MKHSNPDRNFTNPNKLRGKAAAIALLSSLALSGCATATTASPESTPIETTVPVSTPEKTDNNEVLSGEALTEYFEIPADKTGEDLANAYISKENEWVMYGSYPGITTDALNNSTSVSDLNSYFETIANKNVGPISTGLFTEVALSDLNVQNYVTNMDEINFGSIYLYAKTSPEAQDSRNIEPYSRESKVVAFESSTINEDKSETIRFKAETSTNSDKNIAVEQTVNNYDADGTLRDFEATFVVEDGVKKISKLTITTLE